MYKIMCGDVLDKLKEIPDATVQCCVTSPPYFGLRYYGTAIWMGGKSGCGHVAPPRGGIGPASAVQVSGKRKDFDSGCQYTVECKKCGAIRTDSQIGIEKTPELYVGKMVAVFREVKRVLRKDGTLWLNLGDSYAGSGRGRDADGKWNPGKGGSKQETNFGAISGRAINSKSLSKKTIEAGAIGNAWVKPPRGYKAKDLIGIPWRVAFALQADGWWLRQDIIWAKPNPMPESVRDRCTKSHEYIFLLTKSGKYFFDADAIKEPVTESTIIRFQSPNDGGKQKLSYGQSDKVSRISPLIEMPGRKQKIIDSGRNKRSVWTINTKPYSGAHFATFSEEIPTICIKAGTKKGDTILDPFAGSGTTLDVAERLGRDSIGIELNEKYIKDLIEPRMENINPLFKHKTKEG